MRLLEIEIFLANVAWMIPLASSSSVSSSMAGLVMYFFIMVFVIYLMGILYFH